MRKRVEFDWLNNTRLHIITLLSQYWPGPQTGSEHSSTVAAPSLGVVRPMGHGWQAASTPWVRNVPRGHGSHCPSSANCIPEPHSSRHSYNNPCLLSVFHAHLTNFTSLDSFPWVNLLWTWGMSSKFNCKFSVNKNKIAHNTNTVLKFGEI